MKELLFLLIILFVLLYLKKLKANSNLFKTIF